MASHKVNFKLSQYIEAKLGNYFSNTHRRIKIITISCLILKEKTTFILLIPTSIIQILSMISKKKKSSNSYMTMLSGRYQQVHCFANLSFSKCFKGIFYFMKDFVCLVHSPPFKRIRSRPQRYCYSFLDCLLVRVHRNRYEKC